MSLMPCPFCGEQVADQPSGVCPKCGGHYIGTAEAAEQRRIEALAAQQRADIAKQNQMHKERFKKNWVLWVIFGGSPFWILLILWLMGEL